MAFVWIDGYTHAVSDHLWSVNPLVFQALRRPLPMPDLVVDPDNIWHGGRKLCEISEDIESSTSRIMTVPSPSESLAGALSEQAFVRSWDELKYAQRRILKSLIENLDELGTKLKEQSEVYEAADQAAVEALNNVDHGEYIEELRERESSRTEIRSR